MSNVTIKKIIFNFLKSLRNIKLLLIYCVTLLIFFEGISRLLLSNKYIFEFLREYDDDSSWRIEWIRTHQNSIKDTIIKGDTFYCHDTHRGWALKPFLKMVKTDIGKINTNSKGIRGEVEYTYDPPLNKTRILIIGDSFIFGNEVSDTETYSYFLQQMLSDTEVINMGVSGYGHDQMLIYLKEEGIKYKPNIVVLGFVTDDMYRNMLKFRDYAKPKYELVNNELRLRNFPVPPPELILKNEFYRLKSFDLLAMLFQKFKTKYGLDSDKRERLTKAILDEMIKTIKSIGAIPVFIYLPTLWEVRWDNEHIPKGLRLSQEDLFFQYCKERNIHCISFLQYYRANIKAGRKFNPVVIRHYDASEDLMIAQAMKEFLNDQHILKITDIN